MFLRFTGVSGIALLTFHLQIKQILQPASLRISNAIEIIHMDEVEQQTRHINHQFHIACANLFKTGLRHGLKQFPKWMTLGNRRRTSRL